MNRPSKRILAPITISCFLALACQVGGSYYASGEPQPAEWSLKAETVTSDVEAQNIPFEAVAVEPSFVKVQLTYGYQADLPSPARFESDVKALVKIMCPYARGYHLEVSYTDGWTFRLDWHIIRAFCDGVGGQITEEGLVGEGEYLNPSGEWVTPTPTSQRARTWPATTITRPTRLAGDTLRYARVRLKPTVGR